MGHSVHGNAILVQKAMYVIMAHSVISNLFRLTTCIIGVIYQLKCVSMCVCNM